MSYVLYQGDTLNKKDIFGVVKGPQVSFDELGRPIRETFENYLPEKFQFLYILKKYLGESHLPHEMKITVKVSKSPLLEGSYTTNAIPDHIAFQDGYEAYFETFPSGIIRRVRVLKDGELIQVIE